MASRTAAAVKRGIDVIAALAVLVASAPLTLLVAVLIKLEDGGPVLFRQRRVGRDGVPFTVCKFRSMREDAEASTGPVWAGPDDPRVTRIGRWLRPLGIDEIPQAWNVLRGEMSLVGPRPERPEFVDALRHAIPGFDRRHEVRPGITGWAQVHMPHVASLEDARRRSDYDLYYLAHGSLALDLAIIALTLKVLALGGRERAC
jgi:lipopolysaccharide/colanic/teichoic acid biosynthesis glycosyltransferase